MRSRKSSSSRNLFIQRTPDGQPYSGIGPGVGYEFIKAYFPRIKDTLRIASAYFSLKGYRLGRGHIKDDVVVRMLVGKGDALDAQEAILDEIVKELKELDGNLYETIKEVVTRINERRFFIRDARSISNLFHCKFYIGDDAFLWHGSANYSVSGLSAKSSSNAEQASCLT